jgi:hypothetical protein
VPLPIHIEGLPKGVTLGEASLDDPAEVGATGFSMGLAYQSGTEPGTGRQVSISVSSGSQPKPAGSHTDALAKAGIKVSPTPARDTCKDSKGLHICVQEDPGPAGPDPLASVGGAQGLLDRITSLGTDRANWTTHVVN